MTPRSILKRTSEQRNQSSAPHAVHFPPTPSLCSTFSAYSASTYDRSPIVVSKNICALPERGGRTYVLDETTCPRTSARDQSAQQSRPYHSDRRAAVPQLIPDVSSSESDESDGFQNSPYGSALATPYSYGLHGLPKKYEFESGAYSACDDSNGDINPLAFLPYPPSPPAHSDRSRRGRKPFDSAQDLDRIRNSSTSSLEDNCIAPPPPTKKRSSSKRREYLSKLAASSGISSGFGVDDGCLGGF